MCFDKTQEFNFCCCVEKKNFSLKDNVQCLKKLMVGVGCSDLKDAESDDIGSLQSLFDVEQAKNIATYVHEGSVVPLIPVTFIVSI